ncbi:MAG: hypothetical protein D6790_21255 [Caldilineae bacterium]|nr:MAG: hypothetical protein D6790_21255 [Caldilineae bacterium]
MRFQDARRIFSAVQKAVRQAIVQSTSAPHLSLGTPTPAPPAQEPGAQERLSGWAARRDQILQAGAHGQQALDLYTPPPETEVPLVPRAPVSPTSALPEAVEHPAPSRTMGPSGGQGLPPLRVVGQVGATYIVAEGPEGLYLIDQHAAHERIMYEKFMAQRHGSGVARQGLLDPLTLHVGDALAGLVAQHLDELAAVGFEIEPFGGDAFLVRSVPSVLAGQDAARVLEEIVHGLVEERDLVGEELEARLVKMVCKRASIKAGQVLSDIEMKELVRQLEACQSPRTCPHGRPTMIQLSSGELERAFKRT